MKLKEYIDKYKVDPIIFGLECGVRPSTIYAYINGSRRPKKEVAELIQKLSEGLVTVEEARGEHERDKADQTR